MGDLVQAASSGSLTTFALALLGISLGASIAMIVWLVRARMSSRERYDETLEKRLQAGAKKMEGLERDLRTMQIQCVELAARTVTSDQCSDQRKEIRTSIDRLSEGIGETKELVMRMEGRADEGFRQVSRLLGGLIRVPGCSCPEDITK